MNVPALQLADRWIGVPLCAALTVVRRLFEWRLPKQSQPVRKLLIVKLAEQGSTVLADPALRRAVELVGRDNVYFIAFDDNRFILDLLDVIPRANVITVSTRSVPGFVGSMMAAVLQLRRLQFDAAVDLEFFSRGSAALAFLSGAKLRVGFHGFHGGGPYRGDLMTHRLIYNAHLHTSETFLTLVEALRADPVELPMLRLKPAAVPFAPPMFAPDASEVSAVEKMLPRRAGQRLRIILLNANASDLLPLRRWPAERYVTVARRLLEKHPEIAIVFTGAPNEAKAAAALACDVDSPRCLSLAGKTTLRELLVLYTLADVLVTNDSGPAHFATLTPIQVVTLFGPETPDLFAARTPRNTVLWAVLPCSPCVNAYNNRVSPCRNNQCMQAITVGEVVHAVSQAYAKKSLIRQPLPVSANSPREMIGDWFVKNAAVIAQDTP